MNQQYDVIVIGTGEKTKSTVQALEKDGQQVMYIELLPDMLATMVCHHPKKNNPSAQGFDSEKENQMKTKIHLQKQTIQSSVGETTTYTFHVEEVVEVTELERVEVEEDLQEEFGTPSYVYQPPSQSPSSLEPIELKLVDEYVNTNHETIEPEIIDETISFYEEESDSVTQDANPLLYEIEEKQTNDETDEAFSFTEEVTPTIEDDHQEDGVDQDSIHSLSQSLRPSTLSKQKEREHAMREKLIRRRSKLEPSNLLMEKSQTISFEEKSESTDPTYQKQEDQGDRSAFLQSVLNKPSFSPRESRLRKRLGYKPKSPQPTEVENIAVENETHSEVASSFSQQPPTSQNKENTQVEQKVYSFEPFSSRRRARAQKKNRMLTTVERIKSNTNPPIPTTKPFPAVKEEPKEQNLTFQSTLEEPLPHQREASNIEEELQIQTYEESVSEPPFDSLKKDDIEFEDPYGGYSSLDEIFPPYSQNNRKRQEIDEIEKRKIALRGLHNLINNLG